MKKIKYFCITAGLILFSLSSIIAATVAWSNGIHTIGTYSGTIGKDPIPIYKDDYIKSINVDTLREYYGTHDWIAESALELLYNKLGQPTSGFLYQLWNKNNPDNLRIYYLFGTELPDHSTIPSGLRTRCNFQFTITQIHRGGHSKLRFYDDPDSLYYKFLEDDAACQSANKIYYEIMEAFKKKDCQAASVFTGALMHVIADATYFYHLLDNRDTDYFSSHVFHVTFKTWLDANNDRSNEFFNLAEVIGKLTAADIHNPYQATLLAGKNTRFGSLLYQDAEFLLNSDPSDINRQFWADVQGYWTSYSQQHTWTHSMRPSASSAKKYFDTVEHNLNQAVYYCATVLNYILNYAGYTNCECGSGSDQNPNPPPPGGQQDADREGLNLSVEQFNSMFYFSFIGLLATALALALLSKAELLEGLILR